MTSERDETPALEPCPPTSGPEVYRDFATRLAPAVRRAAALARSMEGRVRNVPKLDEETVAKQALTAADTACQEVLLGELARHFPEVALAAEEDTPAVARFAHEGDALVVIDPIDGTLHSYLEGRGPYAVLMGLAWQRRYRAALVALPREGLLFGARAGGGAWWARAGGGPRPARCEADGDRVLVSHNAPPQVSRSLESRGLQPVPASGGACAIAPLVRGVRAGVRCATTSGSVSIRGRIGTLVAREAGALVRGAGGVDFPSDLDTPAELLCVSDSEGDHEILAEALAAAGLA